MDLFEGKLALEDLRWLERLALRLVDDREEALDLSQETLLAAQRASGVPEDARRPWLVRTLRNLASKSRRSRARRGDIERGGARAEALPSAYELAERAEMQRVLLAHVGALPVHYRTPLLLRYYDEVPVAEIASELELPVRTVHTRLHRGLQLLREQMDAGHPEGREGWMRALLPMGLPGGVGVPIDLEPARPGADAAPVAVRTLAALAVLGGGALVAAGFFSTGDDAAESIEAAAVGPTASEGGGASLGDPAPLAGDARTPLVAVSGAPAPAPNALVQVIDWNGAAVAGARIEARSLESLSFGAVAWRPTRLHEGEAHALDAVSDGGGGVALSLDGETVLRASAEGSVCAIAGVWRGREDSPDPSIVLAPSMELELLVVDGFGRPLEGVEALVTIDERVAARFERPFEVQFPLSWSGTSDRSGRVRFAELPAVDEALLTLHRDDLGRREWPLLEAPANPRLGPEDPIELTGRVVDAGGIGLAGATVDAGGRYVETDGEGRFGVVCEQRPRTLWAAHPGRAPMEFGLPPWTVTLDGPEDIGVFVLDAAPEAIEGRVLDADGLPVPGALVWTNDVTRGSDPDIALVLESIAAGGDGYHHAALTDDGGRFRLTGLRPGRRYGLIAMDLSTTLWVEDGPFEAGAATEASLSLATDRVLDRWEGRAVARDGTPLAGVRITVQGPEFGAPGFETVHQGSTTKSDAAGRFVLEGLPREGVWVSAMHQRLIRSEVRVETLLASRDWVLPLAARVRVTLGDAAARATVGFRDADGALLEFHVPVGLGHRPVVVEPLLDGRSPWLDVPVDAVRLEILRDGETESVPLRLTPGQDLHVRR